MMDPKDLIPHRAPFLFVDRIERADLECIVGYRRFPADEPFFAGHFPSYPVVPGVILVETMAQVGGAGLKIIDPERPPIYYFASVDKVKFRRQVRPGDEVRVEVATLRSGKAVVKQAGKAFVGDEVAAEAEWMIVSA